MSDLCTGLPPIQDTAMDVIGATQSISEDHAASLETLRDRIAEAAGLGCILFRGIILAESGSGGEASSRCLLKVFPTLPDPGLVDEPCVKANVFFRGGQLWAEILSSSRDLLSRIQLQNTGSHLDAVVAVLRRDLSPSVFSHCQGLLLGDKLPDYNHLLPHILIGKYNGELVIRSRLCKHVVNLETEQQEELDNSVCLDCRNILKKLNSGRRQPAHQVGKQNKGLVKSELGEEAEDEENSLYFSHFNIDEGGNPSDGTCQDTAEGSKDDAGVSLPPGDIKVEVKDQSVRRRKKRSAKVKEETAEVGGVGGGKRTAPGGEKTTLGPFLPARCPCGIEFSNKKEYKEHMDLIHRPNIAVFSAPYLCPQTNCVKRFKSAHDLEVHERRHRGEKPFKCEECEKLFNTAQELKVHSLRHTGVKLLKCEVCDKRFVRAQQLKIHSRIHSGERPWLCGECGKNYFSQSSLIDHRKRKHLGVFPFPCQICQRGFFSRTEKESHERTHTGAKPFNCTVCGKKFSRVHHLNRHVATVHAEDSSSKKKLLLEKRKNIARIRGGEKVASSDIEFSSSVARVVAVPNLIKLNEGVPSLGATATIAVIPPAGKAVIPLAVKAVASPAVRATIASATNPASAVSDNTTVSSTAAVTDHMSAGELGGRGVTAVTAARGVTAVTAARGVTIVTAAKGVTTVTAAYGQAKSPGLERFSVQEYFKDERIAIQERLAAQKLIRKK